MWELLRFSLYVTKLGLMTMQWLIITLAVTISTQVAEHHHHASNL